MSFQFKPWLVALLVVAGLQLPTRRGDAEPSAKQQLTEAAEAISALELDRAEQLLASLDETSSGQAAARFERARLAFHRGDYRLAYDTAAGALAAGTEKQQQRWQGLVELYRATEEVTRDYVELSSADGRYRILHPSGKDAVLASYALEVLSAGDRVLQEVLGTHLPGPVRLEIYPSPDTLAQLSSLTVEQIRATGTVALCKWNRLMITSPRALVRGYPWADTITHELVHLVLSQMTADRAPVWLQEGTAKLLERKWRDRAAGLHMDPATRELLAEARQAGKLLTFEQMHPSIAMLPSQDDAALAFAQVSTFMDRYVRDHGEAALRQALLSVKNDVDARKALADAAGTKFQQLEKTWQAGLPKSEGKGAARRLELRFREGEGPADEASEVKESTARRHLRIGDLLWDRGRSLAAALEYEKAHRADRLDPIVAARWGRAALDAGRPQEAIDALSPQRERFPGHAPTHAIVGAAWVATGNREAAAPALREAIFINPFDPTPHCQLVQVSSDQAEVARATRACSSLR
ncbi:MAG: peptidase MA family metallohydrolase [Myxococcales bacterium]|nr:peptidase MA family metallohydrolase [Myxococcales bacterium]